MLLKRFLEYITEDVIKQKVSFQFSNRFLDVIDDINSPIVEALQDARQSLQDISLVDIGGTPDTISFTTAIKLSQHFNCDGDELNKRVGRIVIETSEIYHISRSEMRVGRLIKKVLGNKFTDSEVERFVNQYKAITSSSSTRFSFCVTGDGIVSGYQTKNYADGPLSNPLYNSCMNDKPDMISFYQYCPVRLLLLLDADDKILGRALVWTFDGEKRLMDRVYTIKDSDVYKFIDYAEKNGWYRKRTNDSECDTSSFMRGGKYCSFDIEVRMSVSIDDFKYGGVPYMDTMRFAYDNYLSNSCPGEELYYTLDSQEGFPTEATNLEDIYGNPIRVSERDEYVYSDGQDGYIYMDDAVHLNYHSIYPGTDFDDWIEKDCLERSDDFVYCDIDKAWYKKTHCVWSDAHQSWLYRGNAIYTNTGDPVHWDFYEIK